MPSLADGPEWGGERPEEEALPTAERTDVSRRFWTLISFQVSPRGRVRVLDAWREGWLRNAAVARDATFDTWMNLLWLPVDVPREGRGR